MTCGFLIQLVFCQKKLWFIGVEVEQETSAPPPKINPVSAPENMKGNAFDKVFFFLSSTPFFCERNVGNNLDFLSVLEIPVGRYKLKLRLFGSFQWKISVTNGILVFFFFFFFSSSHSSRVFLCYNNNIFYLNTVGFKSNIAYGTVLQEFVLGFLHAVGFYSKSVPSRCRSLFSASFQTFCLTARAHFNTQNTDRFAV